MAQINIVSLQMADEQALFAFFSANSSKGHLFQTYWDWRNKGQFHPGGEGAVVARCDGKICGCIGIVPIMITLGNKTFRGAWQQDSLVQASLRGHGVGKALIEEGAKGSDLVMAKGSSEGMYRLRKTMGFLDAPHATYLVRVFRPRTETKHVKRSCMEAVLAAWAQCLPPPTIDPRIKIRILDHFGKYFDELLLERAHEDILRMRKSSDYLNWRYFQCPGRTYHVLGAQKDETCAAIVLNTVGTRKEEGWIVEIVCPYDRTDLAHALIDSAMEYFESMGIMRIWAFATLPRARGWLKRYGFVATPVSPHFTFIINKESAQLKHLFSRQPQWDFWHGDGDIELYM